MAPTDVTPVLVSAKHFDDAAAADARLVVPMMWGMVPFWHRGTDHRNHGLTTNNCRLEGMLGSRLYAHALRKGQRCVVLSEGFYEWQTTDPQATKASQRPAYYAYMPQREGIRIEQKDSWRERAADLRLLQMAALFDCWTNADGDQLYSYSIVTFESGERFSWLHHRSPAILETQQQVDDWLDFGRVTDAKELLAMLRPATQLQWHAVSSVVNNSRNKSAECNKKVALGDGKQPAAAVANRPPMSKMMQSWLIVGKRPAQRDDGPEGGRTSEAAAKKIKSDRVAE